MVPVYDLWKNTNKAYILIKVIEKIKKVKFETPILEVQKRKKCHY